LRKQSAWIQLGNHYKRLVRLLISWAYDLDQPIGSFLQQIIATHRKGTWPASSASSGASRYNTQCSF
jgi:hypothetical protein